MKDPSRYPLLSDATGGKRRSVTPAWEAGAVTRRLATYRPTSLSVNALLATGSLAEVRRRSRDAVRNSELATAAMASSTANAIGNGIIPIPRVEDDGLRREIMDLWTDELVPNIDADGIQDFYGLQALTWRAMREGGDAFIRIRFRPQRDGMLVPLQLQVMESELCDETQNQVLPGGNRVIAGVEVNRRGRRVAYHMHRQHPGDSLFSGEIGTVRIRAGLILHVFQPTRPGQMRGIPILAPTLVRLRELLKYDDAELLRKQISAMLAGFVIKADPDSDPLGKAGGGTDHDDVPMASLEPGTLQELLPGEDVRFTNPPADGGTYEQFSRVQSRWFATGAGATYEQVTGDLSQINYTSLRGGLIEIRRQIEQIVRNSMCFMLCRPVWRLFLRQAILAGSLPVSAEGIRARWRVTPGWQFLDPEREVRAVVRQIRAGLITREEAVAAHGFDAEDLDATRSRELERERDLGLVYDTNPEAGEAPGLPSVGLGGRGGSGDEGGGSRPEPGEGDRRRQPGQGEGGDDEEEDAA